jgi:hypothetical protein
MGYEIRLSVARGLVLCGAAALNFFATALSNRPQKRAEALLMRRGMERGID